jgi:hypothetical protein
MAEMLDPPEPHTPATAGGWCHRRHDRESGWRRPEPDEARQWCVAATSPLRADSDDPDLLVDDDGYLDPPLGRLDPGTRLRLDSVLEERIFDDEVQTTRRFCVLDGPFAGTCWEITNRLLACAPDRPYGPTVVPIRDLRPADFAKLVPAAPLDMRGETGIVPGALGPSLHVWVALSDEEQKARDKVDRAGWIIASGRRDVSAQELVVEAQLALNRCRRHAGMNPRTAGRHVAILDDVIESFEAAVNSWQARR